MASLRDEITNGIRRLGGRSTNSSSNRNQKDNPDLGETLVATDVREGRTYCSYRVLRRLGTGGMGHVYLAADTRLGRHAALKFLSPKLKSNPEMLARLQQEARTASSLNHPNILTIYDIDEAGGETFIASEFVDGVTLREKIAAGACTLTSALEITIQIASALKSAHQAGIVHRDLKPGNVMIRPDGLVKVIDFGLAKFRPQAELLPLYEPLSDPGSIAGTVQYMSPEQARGDEVDHRTDVWSLGVILYEMVAGRKPFDGDTENHVIVAILDQQVPELKIGRGCPEPLAKLISKALTKSPARRYQSAEDMLTDLTALADSSQIRNMPLWLVRTEAKPRRSGWLWISVTLALLFVVLAIWWWRFDGRQTVLGPDWFVPGTYRQVTNRGDVDTVAVSPDGKRIAYVTRKDGGDQIHLLNLETKSEFALNPYEGETLGITFAPDNSGSFYVTIHDRREWGKLLYARQGSKILDEVLDDVDGPITFSPDGKEFAFHRKSDEKRTNYELIVVARTNERGDQHTILTKVNTQLGMRIAWSLDGDLATNLEENDLPGNVRQTIAVFSPRGVQTGRFMDSRLRRLSGPAWLDSHSMLIFAGFGRETDESQTRILELSTHTGRFRSFSSPPLVFHAIAVSRDLRTIAAVDSIRKSALWTSSSDNLDAAQKWLDGGSFGSFVWNSPDSIVYSAPIAGSIALFETRKGASPRILAQGNDCVRSEPAVVPGTGKIVFSSNCEANANESNLWLLDGKNLTQLTQHAETDVTSVASSDGDTLIYNSWPNNRPILMKMSLRTRIKSQFTVSLQARNAAISPDGQHVVCQIREHYDGQWRVAMLSTRDGAIEKDNLPLPARDDSFSRWSPDSAALDYLNASDPANIWRLPLDGQAAYALTHLHGSRIDRFAWNTNGTRLAWTTVDVKQDVIIFNREGKNDL